MIKYNIALATAGGQQRDDIFYIDYLKTQLETIGVTQKAAMLPSLLKPWSNEYSMIPTIMPTTL
jgi:hypothetical protein